MTDRFWPKVDKADGRSCWPWLAGRNPNGYGWFYDNAKRAPRLAHRVSWEIANGPIGDGLHVLHHCDNPPCVNPAHLYLGSDAENSRDRISRGRARHAVAEANGKTKLTTEQLQQIRELAVTGMRQTEIARRFGVHSSHVSRILAGLRRTYGHSPGIRL